MTQTAPTADHQLISDFLALKPEALQQGHEAILKIRETGSVSFLPQLNMYAVTGYKAVCDVARRTTEFSSRYVSGFRPEDEREYALLSADGKAHARQKGLVSRAFAPTIVKSREPIIRDLVDLAIDQFIDNGRFELVGDFALRFPVYTIAAYLGIPDKDKEQFVHWAFQHIAPIGNPMMSDEDKLIYEKAMADFTAYFDDVIAYRRKNPGEDIISIMLAKSDDGSVPLTNGELHTILGQLLTGGVETSIKLITSAFEYLLANPEQMAKVSADHMLIPNMLEETLRIKAPVHGMFRYTVVDAELDGVMIPKDSMVWLVFSSGGRDEEKFECPHAYDVERANASDHLAFGYGVHRCVGFGLAKLQVQIAFEQLLSRLKNIHLAPENDFAPFPSFVIQGVNALYIEFDKAD